MIWLIIGFLLLVLLLLLTRNGKSTLMLDSRAAALAHYKEQLNALDTDLRTGKISQESYTINKTEISRQLIKESDTAGTGISKADFSPIALAGLVIFIAATSLLTYATLGRPDLSAAPKTSKTSILDQTISKEAGMTYRQALARMDADMQTKGSDKDFLVLYARTHFQLREFAKAADAYSKLSALDTENPRWPLRHAESLMGVAEGRVTPASLMIIEKLLFKAPENPAGQYLKGLYYQQKGDTDQALAIWLAFADKSPADAPWMRTIMPQIRALKYPMPQVDPTQVQQISNLSEAKRQDFFRAMGDRLAERLKSIPDYPEAYLRLARVRMMTGDQKAAISALESGIQGSSDPAQAVPLRQMLDKIKESAENNKM